MYQVKYECGMELVVIKGEFGRVINRNGEIVFEGTLEQAEKYLSDRNLGEANLQNRAHPHKTYSQKLY